jgi:hypothetical protein
MYLITLKFKKKKKNYKVTRVHKEAYSAYGQGPVFTIVVIIKFM